MIDKTIKNIKKILYKVLYQQKKILYKVLYQQKKNTLQGFGGDTYSKNSK